MTVALLTMARSKVEARHAIINAAEQSYKDVHMYLIYQTETEAIVNAPIPLTIDCVNTEQMANGGFWRTKFRRFFEIADEPITAIWDSDDRYEYRYLEKAVAAIGEHDGSWNHTEISVCNDGFYVESLASAYGTIVAKTDVLRAQFSRLDLISETDPIFRRDLEASLDMAENDAMRYYFYQSHMYSIPTRHSASRVIVEFGGNDEDT